MKIITAYSHKGGTGKTTTLMLLASAIQAKGKSALLVDCDPHESFAAYKRFSIREDADLWDDRFDVIYCNYEATTVQAFEQTLLDAEASGKYDYALLNLTGIDHPFNRHALRYAEMTLLPFAPSALDMMELPEALSVIRQLGDEGEVGDARVVFTKMKPKMNSAQLDYMTSVVGDHPILQAKLKETAVAGDIVMRGLLGKTIAHLDDGSKGPQAWEVDRHKAVLEEGIKLFEEIEGLIKASEKEQ